MLKSNERLSEVSVCAFVEFRLDQKLEGMEVENRRWHTGNWLYDKMHKRDF